MALSRRIFSREFKVNAVRELEAGRSLGEVAWALEVRPSVLARWRKEYHRDPGANISGLRSGTKPVLCRVLKASITLTPFKFGFFGTLLGLRLPQFPAAPSPPAKCKSDPLSNPRQWPSTNKAASRYRVLSFCDQSGDSGRPCDRHCF